MHLNYAIKFVGDMALPGGYPNLLGRNDMDRAARSYGANAERLMIATDPSATTPACHQRSRIAQTRTNGR